MKVLKDDANKRYMVPKVVGFVMVCIGVLPFVIWLVHQMGFLLPHEGHDDNEWHYILMSFAMFAIGLTLVSEQGAKITEAFFGWFGRKGGGGSS